MFFEIAFLLIGLVSLFACTLIFKDEDNNTDAIVDINNYMNKSMQATCFPSDFKKVS